jgi:hypothetical protein
MFGRKRSKDDFAEEITAHLELEADELKREGLTDEDARRQARIEFGNVRVAQERFYLKNRLLWLDNLLRDVSFAIRQLIKNPGFAATTILVLALGIGASVAIFAFVDAALVKPLPYADPQRLVHVTERERVAPLVNISYLDYADWKRLNVVFSSLDAFNRWNFLLSAPTGAEPVRGVRVSAGFFRTLGVAPVLRFSSRRGGSGRAELGAAELRNLATAVWRRQGCDRATGEAERHFLCGHRRAAPGFRICSRI